MMLSLTFFAHVLTLQKCADRTVSDKSKFPTFIRTYPTETQVILHFLCSCSLFFFFFVSFWQLEIKDTNALYAAADKWEKLDDSIECSAFSCFTFKCSGAETQLSVSCLCIYMNLCTCKCEIRHGYTVLYMWQGHLFVYCLKKGGMVGRAAAAGAALASSYYYHCVCSWRNSMKWGMSSNFY